MFVSITCSHQWELSFRVIRPFGSRKIIAERFQKRWAVAELFRRAVTYQVCSYDGTPAQGPTSKLAPVVGAELRQQRDPSRGDAGRSVNIRGFRPVPCCRSPLLPRVWPEAAQPSTSAAVGDRFDNVPGKEDVRGPLDAYQSYSVVNLPSNIRIVVKLSA